MTEPEELNNLVKILPNSITVAGHELEFRERGGTRAEIYCRTHGMHCIVIEPNSELIRFPSGSCMMTDGKRIEMQPRSYEWIEDNG